MKFSIPLFILGALVLFFIFMILKKSERNVYKYRAMPLLTPNEIEFYGRIREALPWACVQMQTAMSALIQPVENMSAKARMSAFGRIAQKRVDFVICHEDLSIVCVIELDDKTHSKAKDQARDYVLLNAGIPTLRYESRPTLRPSPAKIRQDIADLIVFGKAAAA